MLPDSGHSGWGTWHASLFFCGAHTTKSQGGADGNGHEENGLLILDIYRGKGYNTDRKPAIGAATRYGAVLPKSFQ